MCWREAGLGRCRAARIRCHRLGNSPLCFSAACASSQASTSGAEQAESAQEGVAKLAGSNIEYFSEGKGDAVVLLPGGSLTAGYIEGLSHALEKAGYRAVRQQKTLHSRIGGHKSPQPFFMN